MTKHQLKNMTLRWGPVAVWAALILGLSSLSPETTNKVSIPGIDKLAHFLEYAVFAVLAARAISPLQDITLPTGAGVMLFMFIFALMDEGYQGLVGRQMEAADVCADLIGAGCGLWLHAYYIKKRKLPLFFKLVLLFTLVPLMELMLLFGISSYWNWWITILLVVATGIVGGMAVRWQGLRVLTLIRDDMALGIMPTEPLMDGALVLISGALLVTPGILTDLTGVLLLMPGIRKRIRKSIAKYFNAYSDAADSL